MRFRTQAFFARMLRPPTSVLARGMHPVIRDSLARRAKAEPVRMLGALCISAHEGEAEIAVGYRELDVQAGTARFGKIVALVLASARTRRTLC